MTAFLLLLPLTSALLLQPQLHAFPPARWLATARSSPCAVVASEQPAGKTAPTNSNRMVQLIDKLKAADFQHPRDREATAALRRLAPVEWSVRQAFRTLNVDDASFLDNIAKGILVGPEQLPALHAGALMVAQNEDPLAARVTGRTRHSSRLACAPRRPARGLRATQPSRSARAVRAAGS